MRVTTSRLPANGPLDATRLNDQVKQTLDPLLKQPLSQAKTFTGLAVTAGTVFTVTHGLGRAYVGYEVVRSSNNTGVIQVREVTTTPATDPTQAVSLYPTATGTISLRVF